MTERPQLQLNLTPEQSPAPALGGHETTAHVVAIEVDDREAILLIREATGIRQERRPFRPWLLAAAPASDAGGEWTELAGEGLIWLGEFEGFAAALAARDALREAGRELLWYGSPVKQFQVRSGVTLFGELQFQDAHRLQFDLETTNLRGDRPDARILLIAACDNRGGEWMLAGDDEAALLREFVDLIREQDPDILEGHNLLGFDLPYLEARGRALGVRLTLGRNGSELRFGAERRCPAGPRAWRYRPARIWGRHCLDTLFAVQRFDVGRGELESYSLKAAARHYGIAEPERIILDSAQMARLAREESERVREYALQDVRETRALAELTLPTEFYQAQMIPAPYQSVATGGTGEKINSLLVREYLRQGYGAPVGETPRPAPGGYTEVRQTGILQRVVKCDVESLYPSIMLHYGIHPQTDTLGVFLPMLKTLTGRRLAAKQRMRETADAEQRYWDGIQGSLKILINSFYGYLGAALNFNDPAAAAEVTTTGQRLIQQVADRLEATGSQVIEIDTDGIYFVAPEGVDEESDEAAYIEAVGRETLPKGIHLAHDGRYRAMLSLKIKNYALLTADGRLIRRGASLRSRADERFGREFLTAALLALLEGRPEALGALYAETQARLLAGTLPLADLVRAERFSNKSLATAARRMTPRALEVARSRLGRRLSVYERQDGALALAEEYDGDEDRVRYLEKLHRFAARLRPALPDDFERFCPRPDRKRLEAELAGQTQLSL